MTTLTADQTQAIADRLRDHHLPVGIGTKEEACSVASINLALTGRLTDDIPDCMSEVIGRWIIVTQDRMSDSARNSPDWKALLPLAAGTGRDREEERRDIVLDAMWDALAWVQPVADRGGYGETWATMLRDRTPYAYAANAYAATNAAAYAANAYAATNAAASAAYAAADAAASAAYAAADAAASAAYAADAAAYDEWAIATLERLVQP